jgi:hypothetical protein
VSSNSNRTAPIESKGRSITGKRKEDGIVHTPDVIILFILNSAVEPRRTRSSRRISKGYLCCGAYQNGECFYTDIMLHLCVIREFRG